uniref:Platelet derived growth factor d n=1 Tax=Sander lucioperca TaxID=283035 RepID=A0A8C9YK09_SANLU
VRACACVCVCVCVCVCMSQYSKDAVFCCFDSNRLTTDLYCKEENITVTSVGGAIPSPRYPNAYPRNLLLSWKLVSPPGSHIHLEFDGHFGLEEADNGVCRYDFVEVEDQSETSTIIWGRWCGQKAPPSLKSKTNTLRVTFKSDDYFVAKPGFKVYYSLLFDCPLPASITNWEAVTIPMLVSHVPFSLEDLDRTIAAFDTVEQLFRSLSPDTWRQDLDSIYTQTHIHYRSRAYHLASRHNKVDLNRLFDDVKRYSCTPRNYSVNLREELRATNAVFFPRCLLNWNNGCTCQASKTTLKLHEVDTQTHTHTVECILKMITVFPSFILHHERGKCTFFIITMTNI